MNIILTVICRSSATLPMLDTITTELYPTEIRTLSIGIAQTVKLFSAFLSAKIYVDLVNLIGLPGMCILYSVICLTVIIWGAIKIPDNRGKSLAKLEDDLQKNTQVAMKIAFGVLNSVATENPDSNNQKVEHQKKSNDNHGFGNVAYTSTHELKYLTTTLYRYYAKIVGLAILGLLKSVYCSALK